MVGTGGMVGIVGTVWIAGSMYRVVIVGMIEIVGMVEMIVMMEQLEDYQGLSLSIVAFICSQRIIWTVHYTKNFYTYVLYLYLTKTFEQKT